MRRNVEGLGPSCLYGNRYRTAVYGALYVVFAVFDASLRVVGKTGARASG